MYKLSSPVLRFHRLAFLEFLELSTMFGLDLTFKHDQVGYEN